MFKQKYDIFTGFFILIGLGATILTLLMIIAYNVISDRERYILRMERLAGVKKGTQIRIKNFPVGEVGKVIPIYGSSVYFKAEIYIDRELSLYKGTRVNITNQNVIGDTVIELYPVTHGKYRLKRGDTLFATNIVNLDEMLTKISTLVDNVNIVVESFSDISGESGLQLRVLLANLNRSILRVNSMLASSEGDMLAILRNLTSTTATLDSFTKEFAADPWKVLEKKDGGKKKNVALP